MLVVRRSFAAGLALAAVVLVARAAVADVCVVVNVDRDTFSPQDRQSARIVLGDALEKAGQGKLVQTGCSATWTVANVKLGNLVRVTITGPNGTQEGTAATLDDVPGLYEQLVRALLAARPAPLATIHTPPSGPTTTSTPAPVEAVPVTPTSPPPAPRPRAAYPVPAPRAEMADSIYYAKLGYSPLVAGGLLGGPGLSGGWRFESNSWGIDMSADLAVGISNDGNQIRVSGSFLRLEGLYFLSPDDPSTVFLGAGLSWGGVVAPDTGNEVFTGTGLQGELSAGYEFLRTRALRVFFEADATLPFYFAPGESGAIYAPTFIASFGIGFGGGGLGWPYRCL